MNCIFSIPSLLHHFLSFRSSVLPLSFQSEVLFILLSPQSLLSFLHYTRCLLPLCSPLHYFPLCCSNPSPSFLHLSSPPPRHRPLLHLLLPLFLCSCFFTSSFASFLRYIFLSPPSIPHSLHPLGSGALDGKPQRGKRKRWREENNLEEDKDKR